MQRYFAYLLCEAYTLFISSELFCVLDRDVEGTKREEVKTSKIRIPARRNTGWAPFQSSSLPEKTVVPTGAEERE